MPKARYAELFDVVEVQQTFYEPPQVKTLEKWRTEVPDEFEFVVKAWQLITHTAKSPTYRRLKYKLTDDERPLAGEFQPSPVVELGWQDTRDRAAALRASKILFQCPASFKPTEDNLDNLRRFFTHDDRSPDRRGFSFLFEPRGADWHPELVKELCDELKLAHVVDPFKAHTTTPDRAYFRLHGRGGYNYTYDDAELRDLLELVRELPSAYVMFNNVQMKQDAQRFAALVRKELR
jgi:uncharacterized protein YecE (DUF72 family)